MILCESMWWHWTQKVGPWRQEGILQINLSSNASRHVIHLDVMAENAQSAVVFCMVHFCCLTCLPFGCPGYRDVSNTELPAGNTWVVIWPRESGVHQYSSLEVAFKSFSIIIFFTAFRIGNIPFCVLGVELKIGLFSRYFWNDRVKIWKWLFRLWRWIWILCCSFVGRECGVKDRVWAYTVFQLAFVYRRSE